MKILTFIFVIALMTPNVVTERVDIDNKNDNKGRTLDSKKCAEENCKKDVTGNRRCALYILNDPHQLCYTRYFVRGQPPVGLRTGSVNLQNIRYICQPPSICGQFLPIFYYATMFDEGRGIAVFSAYTLTQATADFVNFPGRDNQDWYPTPGITKQGSHAIYRDQPYHRGHLVPARTYSSSQSRHDSTYTYTNGVPQCPTFNTGMWSQFERRIRRYAENICTQPLLAQPGQQAQPAGTLYLLTGTSFVRIQPGNPPQANVGVAVNQLGNLLIGEVDIPISLWTAGCCIRQNGQYTRSFAVMGNNVETTHQASLTRQVTVAQLQNILAADVNNLNIGGPNVVLFPGDVNCVNNDLGNLPPAGQGR